MRIKDIFAVVLAAGLLGGIICTGVSTAGEPAAAVSAGARTELLWPDGAPGAKGNADKDKPTLTIYLPEKEKANGSAVVIFPGGGYWTTAMDHEGRQIARWLNGLGIAGFIVDYRHRGRGYGYPAPMQDAQRAIRIVRSRAGEFNISPDKIGVIGFSAGGHLASTTGTHFDEKFYEPKDEIDRASARPDFMILIYPLISLSEWYGHEGAKETLLGKRADRKLSEDFSNEKQVTSRTPPTFLVHTTQDTTVQAENSIYFYLACRKARIPAEIHIYARGKHGFGLGKPGTAVSTWPGLCAKWLAGMGMCKRSR